MKKVIVLLHLLVLSFNLLSQTTKTIIYNENGAVTHGGIEFSLDSIVHGLKFWPDTAKDYIRVDIKAIYQIDVEGVGTFERFYVMKPGLYTNRQSREDSVLIYMKKVYGGMPFSLYEVDFKNENKHLWYIYYWHNQETNQVELLKYTIPYMDENGVDYGVQPRITDQVKREAKKYGVAFPDNYLSAAAYTVKDLTLITRMINKDNSYETTNNKKARPRFGSVGDYNVVGIWADNGEAIVSRGLNSETFSLIPSKRFSAGLYVGREWEMAPKVGYLRTGLAFGYGQAEGNEKIENKPIKTILNSYCLRTNIGFRGVMTPENKVTLKVGLGGSFTLPFYSRQLNIDGHIGKEGIRVDNCIYGLDFTVELLMQRKWGLEYSYGFDGIPIDDKNFGRQGISLGRLSFNYYWQ